MTYEYGKNSEQWIKIFTYKILFDYYSKKEKEPI